ncbi:hypothetical protein GWK47_054380 [Chionoecetes opilio]|uniref:Uncharacterized protein n=1 Tax=Chionoecetes opilio TaxID=41210 RepID=A0A8J4Y0B0_CHIOP|nr:hypothetical protein GWK47_054380 [Chionoecetes opilio]
MRQTKQQSHAPVPQEETQQSSPKQQTKQNCKRVQSQGHPQNAHHKHSHQSDMPHSSRFFRMLQTLTDTLPDGAEPQGPVHIPNIQQQQKPSPQQPVQYQPPSHYQPTTLYQQPGGVTSSAPTEEAPPEPKKYMGGNIPSRSFRMLQALTSTDDASDNGVPANGSEVSHPPDSDTQHTASQIPSPAWKTSIQRSPPSLSPSSTHTTTNDSSSDSGIFSSSKVSPSYTTTEDSRVYRNVSPKVIIKGPKQGRVVNSALSAKEPTSPFSQSVSSPTWKNSHAPKFFSSTHPTPVVVRSNESNGQDLNQECPRLMNIVRQESTSSQNSQEGTERRYEGGHIPSRVFRHLQTEYPDSPDDNQNVKAQGNTIVQLPQFEVKAIPSRVVRSHQSSGCESDKSSSCAELDDCQSNGMTRTAAHKDTVMKELTSQFGDMGTMKKPRAAPGKVFRYLQNQYDTSDDDQHQEVPQQQTEDAHSFGYRGSKLPSPSFRFLQNQYHQQESPEETFCEDSQVHTAPEYEEEPLPYQGARLPGRTFRSIQENMGAHPSVLQPRK